MSYDLMVFKTKSAPNTEVEFKDWYHEQTKWSEGHSYDDPENTCAELKDWFLEMIKIFPAMNGPYAKPDVNDKDDRVTDYCIGRDLIYICFSWSEADEAYNNTIQFAKKYQLGFFEVSSGNGDVLVPSGNGDLITLFSILN